MSESEKPEVDMKNRKDLDDAGGKPKNEDQIKQPEEIPLFLRNSSEGRKGDAQDEKDNMEE